MKSVLIFGSLQQALYAELDCAESSSPSSRDSEDPMSLLGSIDDVIATPKRKQKKSHFDRKVVRVEVPATCNSKETHSIALFIRDKPKGGHKLPNLWIHEGDVAWLVKYVSEDLRMHGLVLEPSSESEAGEENESRRVGAAMVYDPAMRSWFVRGYDGKGIPHEKTFELRQKDPVTKRAWSPCRFQDEKTDKKARCDDWLLSNGLSLETPKGS